MFTSSLTDITGSLASDSEHDDACIFLANDAKVLQNMNLDNSVFAKCLQLAAAAQASERCKMAYEPLKRSTCRAAAEHASKFRQQKKQEIDMQHAISLPSSPVSSTRSTASSPTSSSRTSSRGRIAFPLPPPSKHFFRLLLHNKELTGKIGAAHKFGNTQRVILDLNTDPPRSIAVQQASMSPFGAELFANYYALQRGLASFCNNSNGLHQAEAKMHKLDQDMSGFIGSSLEPEARAQKRNINKYFNAVEEQIDDLQHNRTVVCRK